MLIPRSVSHHRPAVRDDRPFQYDTNDWFSIEKESLLFCLLAVISLRITWETAIQIKDHILTGYLERRAVGVYGEQLLSLVPMKIT